MIDLLHPLAALAPALAWLLFLLENALLTAIALYLGDLFLRKRKRIASAERVNTLVPDPAAPPSRREWTVCIITNILNTVVTYERKMLKSQILIAAYVLLAGSLSGQMTLGLNRDSLRSAINAGRNDTTTVDSYILLGQQYETNIPDSAIYYYEQAHALSVKLNYPAGIVRYINNYTAILNVQGKFDESLKLHEQALAICDHNHLDALKMKVLFNIGVVYQYKQDYKAAADVYLTNLGFFERQAGPRALSLVYGNLCGLYKYLGEPDKAVEYASRSVKYAEESKDLYSIGQGYINMANALRVQKKFHEQEDWLNRAYTIAKKTNNINLEETVLINMGDMFSETAQPEKYIAWFERALPLADSLGDVYGRSLALQGIANGLFHQKAFSKADKMARASLDFARKNEQGQTEAKALLLLSDIQAATGDLVAYEQYRDQYDSVNNAVVNKDMIKNVQELETKYELEKKQSQILKQGLLLEQKNRESFQQRVWLWILVIGLLLMGLVIFWGVRYYRQRQLLSKQEGQLLERKRISQEMHDDIGSGLTAILFLSRRIAGSEAATLKLRQTAESLIRQMNEIIWVMNSDQDSVDRLIAYMRVQIAEALDNAGIDYDFSVTDPLPATPLTQEFRRNMYLSAKEAVHNCIKHAKATHVNIDIQVNNEFEVSIKDNGQGLKEREGVTGAVKDSSASSGNGLTNMRQRMEKIGGLFSINSTGQGTAVFLSAPIPL